MRASKEDFATGLALAQADFRLASAAVGRAYEACLVHAWRAYQASRSPTREPFAQAEREARLIFHNAELLAQRTFSQQWERLQS